MKILLLCPLILVASSSFAVVAEAAEIVQQPEVPATENMAALATHLTSLYMTTLPEKPKTNEEYLRLMVTAYKNLEKAISEADKNDYRVEIVGTVKPKTP